MARRAAPRDDRLTRRSFLAGAAAVVAAARVRGQDAVPPIPPGDPVRVAVVGVGGQGLSNLKELAAAGARIVALCDCDARQAGPAFDAWPEARRYSDWRVLLERERDVEAVLVSTPDHNHAMVSIAAMRAGKHVYCEKPLARSIWEAREMARVAAQTRVATQMGTQGHSYEGTRRAVEVLRAGAIGEVRELHVWTDRPAGWWPQGVLAPREGQPIPEGLDWDVWLGPAATRPYHEAYLPFKWRGFWDFGTGAIGDMGIHTLDTAYWGLELGVPTRVAVRDCAPGLADPTIKDTAPVWSILDVDFPARGSRPPVRMTWYDGGKLPPIELFQGEKRISNDGGSLVVGSKGTLFTRTWHGGQEDANMFVLLPRTEFVDYVPPAPTLPRTEGHHREWLDACRGRAATQSPFSYAAGLTEALLVGNLALRMGRPIDWDAAAMRATGIPEADPLVRPVLRDGWSW